MNVWLIVPAYRRLRVSTVAFAGIRWTLDELGRRGIAAQALVIADDANLKAASDNGFATLERPNRPLGQKWNDGYEHACRAGATHVMPCGSDDWIHPDLIEAMLAAGRPDAIVATRGSCAVAPDGSEVSILRIPYEGGDGIRLLPEPLLRRVNHRPTADKRDRAIDGAMRDKLHPIYWIYVESDPLSIVDFKSDTNLTAYEKFATAGYVADTVPFDALRDLYPAALVDQAHEMYGACR